MLSSFYNYGNKTDALSDASVPGEANQVRDGKYLFNGSYFSQFILSAVS